MANVEVRFRNPTLHRKSKVEKKLLQQLNPFLRDLGVTQEEFILDVIGVTDGPSKGPWVRPSNYCAAMSVNPAGLPIKIYTGDSRQWQNCVLFSPQIDRFELERRMKDSEEDASPEVSAPPSLTQETPAEQPLVSPIATAPTVAASEVPKKTNGHNGHAAFKMSPQTAFEIVMEARGASELQAAAAEQHAAAVREVARLETEVSEARSLLAELEEKLAAAKLAERQAQEALASATPNAEHLERVQAAVKLVSQITASVIPAP